MEVYAEELAKAMAEIKSPWQVRHHRPSRPAILGSGIWSMRIARYFVYPLLIKQEKVGLNHILDHGYGHLLYWLEPKRTIVTVHDLIPLLRWKGAIQGAGPTRKPWLTLLSLRALRNAGHVIAVSRSTKNDLVEFLDLDGTHVSVIPNGVDDDFRQYSPSERQKAARRIGLPGNRIRRVLIMGREFYKNHETALRAFSMTRERADHPLELVKVGLNSTELNRMIEEVGLSGATRDLGFVNREQMPDVYNSVDCLLFPSLYEGFGLPVLEAMACGTPVVTSNAGSLPEVAGDAALVLDPRDAQGIADGLIELLGNRTKRKEYIARGRERATKFSWQETARETTRVYDRLVNRA